MKEVNAELDEARRALADSRRELANALENWMGRDVEAEGLKEVVKFKEEEKDAVTAQVI